MRNRRQSAIRATRSLTSITDDDCDAAGMEGEGVFKKSGDGASTRTRAISLKMSVVARQLHKSFDQRVTCIGVTRSQWTMIAVIARHPGATQREVAEMLEMSEASAGRLIDRLCADGLLERRPKEDDRRAYCIHLTGAASALLEKISDVASEHEKIVFAGFTDDDLDRLDAYLDMLANNVSGPR